MAMSELTSILGRTSLENQVALILASLGKLIKAYNKKGGIVSYVILWLLKQLLNRYIQWIEINGWCQMNIYGSNLDGIGSSE